MTQVFQLARSPFEAWVRIASEERGVLGAILLQFLPLALAGLALEGWSLMVWGTESSVEGRVHRLDEAEVIRYAAAWIGLNLAAIAGSAVFARAAAAGLLVGTTLRQCLVLFGYAFTPLAVARAIDALPVVHTWVCWGIGIMLASSLLYHGVGPMLRPDQTKGLGMYLTAVIVAVIFSGLAHFFALSVLKGRLSW